ncbi:hypothetical protein BDN67DRAFT_1016482 [Paxillus ammoniavirescens]|nr:hypothetical protein BDN67DRAFT_1016482 [Paxillus ammoniavirescens]
MPLVNLASANDLETAQTTLSSPTAYVEVLKRNWAKGPRLEFLTGHITEYATAAVEGTSQSSEYLDTVINKYFQCFHWKLKVSEDPEPSVVMENGPVEKLTSIEAEQKGRKVVTMPYAHGWSITSRPTERLVRRANPENDPWAWLLGQLSGVAKKRPKVLQPHQRWSKDHFKNDMKDNFEAQWSAADRPNKERATFRDQYTRDQFLALDTDTQAHYARLAKEEGKNVVDAWTTDLSSTLSMDPADRQAALDRLPSFAGPLLAGVHEILGMHVTLLVGGAEPHKHACTKVVTITLLHDYLSTCYTQDECDQRKLPPALDGLYTMLDHEKEADEVAHSAPEPAPSGKKKTKKATATRKSRMKRRGFTTSDGFNSESDGSAKSPDTTSSEGGDDNDDGDNEDDDESANEDNSRCHHSPLPFSACKVDYIHVSSNKKKKVPSQKSQTPAPATPPSQPIPPPEEQCTPTPTPSSQPLPPSQQPPSSQPPSPPPSQDECTPTPPSPSPDDQQAALQADPSEETSATLEYAPKWFHTVFSYLRTLNLPHKFRELLATYVRLEKSSGFAMEKGAAYAPSSKAWPDTIHWWILCAWNGRPPIQQVDKFSNEDIPQLREISGDWNELDKPGLNGFLSVVVALNWWGAKVNGKGWQVSFWQAAIEDVQWVMEQLISLRHSQSTTSGTQPR